jgi:O-antigen ligase
MAAMCLCVSVGLFFFPLSTANDRLRGFVLAFCVLVAVVLTGIAFPGFNLSGLLDTRFLTMQETSSIERLDLATVGWAQVLEHPLTGIGTWQFARSYVSIIGKQELLGIHSIFVQFACEYGILGVIFVSLVVFINIWALYYLSLGGVVLSNFARSGLVWAFTMIGYNTIFSPFAGDARFQYGLLFSGILAILLKSRNTCRRSKFIATTSNLN